MKDNSKSVNLNVLNVALMFVGAIMGAGFASGVNYGSSSVFLESEVKSECCW